MLVGGIEERDKHHLGSQIDVGLGIGIIGIE